MYSGRPITFGSFSSPREQVPPKSKHLVVCESDNDLAQVIAANYAFSLRAGLSIIDHVDDDWAEDFLDRFYTLYDSPHASPTETLTSLRDELRAIVGNVSIPDAGSVSFITKALPYGFAFSEVPSTHLFSYPDLGSSIVHGFAAEQERSRGIQVAAQVDPGTTPAPEIATAVKSLSAQGTFVRVYQGPGADVTSVTEMIKLFPYDLLLIATHCGDPSGCRWTYEYEDTEGIQRTLVVDVAVGVGRTSTTICWMCFSSPGLFLSTASRGTIQKERKLTTSEQPFSTTPSARHATTLSFRPSVRQLSA